jgi:hypothetical protein
MPGGSGVPSVVPDPHVTQGKVDDHEPEWLVLRSDL